jgi:hypothetical protein
LLINRVRCERTDNVSRDGWVLRSQRQPMTLDWNTVKGDLTMQLRD